MSVLPVIHLLLLLGTAEISTSQTAGPNLTSIPDPAGSTSTLLATSSLSSSPQPPVTMLTIETSTEYIGSSSSSSSITTGPIFTGTLASAPAANTSLDDSADASAMSLPPAEDPRYPLYIMGFFPISGDSLQRGSSAHLAANLALEHINADTTGILPGYRLAMNWNDSNCNAGVATQELFEFINSGTQYHMLLGAGCSSVAQTVSLAADLWNIIQISYSASSPALSVRNQYKSFFRTNAADSQYNNARLAMIKRFNWTKVATLHENQEVFSTAINDFSTSLADNNIELITSESFTVDPKEQITNLKTKGAWVIFGNFYEGMARRVFCEAFKQKLYGKHYAWFLPGTYYARWWEAPDSSITCTPDELYTAIKGYISTENYPLSIYKDDVTISGLTAGEFEEVLDERFAEMANLSSAFVPNKAAASYAYDATWTIALTLNRTLSAANNSNRLENFTYDDTAMRTMFMKTLYDLEFEGVSGTVSFTEEGNREGLIEIRQMKGKVEENIGHYSPQEESLSLENIEWEGGTAPKDSTTVTNVTLYIPYTYTFVAAGFSGVGILLIVICTMLLAFGRHRSVFSRAMPGYLGILLFGCALLYVSVVLLGVDANLVGSENFPTVCKISSATMTIGFACAYGVLFAKIYRAHKLLVTKTNLWKPDPHGWHMAKTLLIILVVDVITLVVWMAAFPMQSTVEIVTERPNYEENVLYRDIVEFCNKGNSVYFIVGLLVFHGLTLLLGAFLSYETRELKIISLNDTFVTGIAIYCVVTLSVVTAPLSFILTNTPQVAFAVIGALVWCAVTLLLSIIFIPKLLALGYTLLLRKDSNCRSDDEIYEEEVDEETKLRHKIDEVDKDIEVVKAEIKARTKYGRQGVSRGCGLWCLGHFLGCNCGKKSSQIAETNSSSSVRTAEESAGCGESRTLAYDNKGMQISEWDLHESSGGAAAPAPGVTGSADRSDDPPPAVVVRNGSAAVHGGKVSGGGGDGDIESSDITVAAEAYHEPPKYSAAIEEKARRRSEQAQSDTDNGHGYLPPPDKRAGQKDLAPSIGMTAESDDVILTEQDVNSIESTAM